MQGCGVKQKKKIKKGTVESKKRVSNRKREKKAADRKKGVKQQKHIQKKSFKMPTRVGSRCSRLGRRLRARRRRSRRGSSLLCSLLPFMPWVVAAGSCVQRVTCGCCRGWLQGPHLGSEVALCVGAWRGRGLLLQLHSESLEGSWFSLSYRVGLGRVSLTPTADKKKFRQIPPRRHIRHGRHGYGGHHL